MELKGQAKFIGETKAFGANGFQKRTIAIVVPDEKYPQTLAVEFTQDKCALLDAVNVGDDVTIGVNLRGREWESPQGEIKYFNEIVGWRIAVDNAAPIHDPLGLQDEPAF